MAARYTPQLPPALVVEGAVLWGLQHRRWEPLHVIGIDEVSRRKGQRYLTIVYDLSRGRVVRVGRDQPSRVRLPHVVDLHGEHLPLLRWAPTTVTRLGDQPNLPARAPGTWKCEVLPVMPSVTTINVHVEYPARRFLGGIWLPP